MNRGATLRWPSEPVLASALAVVVLLSSVKRTPPNQDPRIGFVRRPTVKCAKLLATKGAEMAQALGGVFSSLARSCIEQHAALVAAL
jgi:hypothetical protein